MVAEVRNFAVTVPSGTAIATPQVTALTMPARVVRKVRVRIPPGPAGQVGWALGSAGVRVLPFGANQWIVGDDEAIEWELEDQITSGAWQLHAYNLGAFAHTLYLTFLVDPPGSRSAGILLAPLALRP